MRDAKVVINILKTKGLLRNIDAFRTPSPTQFFLQKKRACPFETTSSKHKKLI
ncbi:hypothetical protein SAMN04487898_11663 [Pedobacter sp. ok626]|nr:hypothetical protein SAMN04487898_11663 [Pedobacter sp. ok626]